MRVAKICALSATYASLGQAAGSIFGAGTRCGAVITSTTAPRITAAATRVRSVNASPEDFASGRDDLVKAQAFYPGWLDRLLTTPVRGLENYEEMLRHLTEDKEAIKVYVEVASSNGRSE